MTGWVEDKIAKFAKLIDYFQNSGEMDKQLEYILKTFEYAAQGLSFVAASVYIF